MADWMDPRHRNRARFDGYLRKLLLDYVKVKPKNCKLRVFETFLPSETVDRPGSFADDEPIVRTANFRIYHSQWFAPSTLPQCWGKHTSSSAVVRSLRLNMTHSYLSLYRHA